MSIVSGKTWREQIKLARESKLQELKNKYPNAIGDVLEEQVKKLYPNADDPA